MNQLKFLIRRLFWNRNFRLAELSPIQRTLYLTVRRVL